MVLYLFCFFAISVPHFIIHFYPCLPTFYIHLWVAQGILVNTKVANILLNDKVACALYFACCGGMTNKCTSNKVYIWLHGK